MSHPVFLKIQHRVFCLKGVPEEAMKFLERSYGSLLMHRFSGRAGAELEIKTLPPVPPRKIRRKAWIFHKGLAFIVPGGSRKICIRYEPWLRVKRLFYYVIEPLLTHLMKRCAILPFHAAGVCKDGAGILIPGDTGAGKTSLAYRFARAGFRILSDDRTYLMKGKTGGIEMAGYREPLALDQKAIQLFPELGFLKRARKPVLHGGVPKWHLDLDELKPLPGVRAARYRRGRTQVKKIFFPELNLRERQTRLIRLSEAETLARLLKNRPPEFPSILHHAKTIQFQFDLLAGLSAQADAYRLLVGRKTENDEEWMAPLLPARRKARKAR